MAFLGLLLLTVGVAHAQWQPQPEGQGVYATPHDPQRERNLLPPPPQQYFLPPPEQQPQNPDTQGDTYRSLTPPSLKFKIAIVSGKAKGTNRDEDTGKFKSFLWEGSLYFMDNRTDPTHPNITVVFEENKGGYPMESGLNFGGRGFQLSTLNTFNQKLFACDSKTGIVYELRKIEESPEKQEGSQGQNRYDNRQGREFDQLDEPSRPADPEPQEKKFKYLAQPWVVLSNENSNKPFKCEWAIVRDEKLWLGSTGSLISKDHDKIHKHGPEQVKQRDEAASQGDESGELDDSNSAGNAPEQQKNQPKEFNKERQIVKRVDVNGEVESVDFSKHYEKLAEAYEVNLKEGHVIHEAAEFDDLTSNWVFIPRRVTKEAKNKESWGSLSTNRGIVTDDPFENLNVIEFGKLTETLGVVELKYIPGTNGKFLLALKTGKDAQGNEVSNLVVYDETGYEIMPETTVAEGSFSAVEFI